MIYFRMLLDIQGEPSTDNPKVLGLDDVIDFGKYKGVTIREVIEKDWHYIEWAVLQSQRLYVDVEAVVNYHESCIVSLKLFADFLCFVLNFSSFFGIQIPRPPSNGTPPPLYQSPFMSITT